MSLIQLLETGRSLAERIPYSLVALVARLAVADVFWTLGPDQGRGLPHPRGDLFPLPGRVQGPAAAA